MLVQGDARAVHHVQRAQAAIRAVGARQRDESPVERTVTPRERLAVVQTHRHARDTALRQDRQAVAPGARHPAKSHQYDADQHRRGKQGQYQQQLQTLTAKRFHLFPTFVICECFESVASEGRLRVAGAQEAECTRQYMSIPSTAGAQDAERSSSQSLCYSAANSASKSSSSKASLSRVPPPSSTACASSALRAFNCSMRSSTVPAQIRR